jgi:hypothetical protein
MGASTFRGDHGAAAVRVAAATKSVEADVARLSSHPGSTQLLLLGRAAALAHRELVAAGEWAVAGQGEEGAEEEDVPRAETQVTEAATEMAGAMTALQGYARAPSTAALARYASKLVPARQQWDEGISQLWFLAHAAGAPTA